MRGSRSMLGCAALLSLVVAVIAAAPGLAAAQPATAKVAQVGNATVERMENDIPLITGPTDYDVIFALGYVHAQDRLFQMDVQRHMFSGTLAELVGQGALASDIQLRTLGLRRAAEASLPVVSQESREWMQAYSDGVNAYLQDPENPIPLEYGALELTRSSIAPWTPIDTLVLAKGLAFGLSFDLSDIDYTRAYLTFQAVGAAAGFDGAALMFQDLYRTAPFDPTIAIPNFTGYIPVPSSGGLAKRARVPPAYLNAKTARLLDSYRNAIADIPVLRQALDGPAGDIGSNWWVTSGSLTSSDNPILANDPHLSLGQPAVFYEVWMKVTAGDNPMDVFGVAFPGTPIVVQGCNTSICWGSTVNPMDVTDVYQEKLALNPSDFLPMATYFDGQWQVIRRIPQRYFVNQVGNGTPDDIVDGHVPYTGGGMTFVVPLRNNGPIVSIDTSNINNITGLSVQYTGWGPTREVDTFRIWARASNLDQFKEGLSYFDFGSQNWSYADVEGNIAYFTSAELPLREDLQTLQAPAEGIPPYLIRDGTNPLHQWMPLTNPQPGQDVPYEILPFDEMPQVVNPDKGYVISANNDPVGTSLDNNPINQLRTGGGIYYLSPGYASGFRAGRIQRLYDAQLASDVPFDVSTIMTFQHNNQLLDAEVFAPMIVAAYDASSSILPGGLNPMLDDAVEYLRNWDFSTPTGIQAGYDPGDDPTDLPAPSQEQIDASVAATVYAAWRGQMVRNVIDAPLAQLGIDAYAPGSDLAVTALRNLVDNIDTNHGVGASGITFITGGDVNGAMLVALSQALTLLQSDEFAPAFHNSTNLEDYRWGYLHRIVFANVLGGPFSIPPAGGLSDLAPDLPGIARSGGFGAVDASSHSARADTLNGFMFSHGPARRFVGEVTPEITSMYQTIPGGESGQLGSPHEADSLLLWLTDRYLEHFMMGPGR